MTLNLIARPLELPCGQVLSNRLVKAATSEQLASPAHAPTEAIHDLYGAWGQSGAGLLITGNVMIDRNAVSEPGQVVLAGQTELLPFRAWAQRARAGGNAVWMQLNHAGRQIPITLSRHAVAPSPIRQGPLFARPVQLSRPEIQSLVERFATAAAQALRSGFDGVQIHAAHGYLISQFLSPRANLRTDDYGGSSAKRRRFLLEVIEAVRGAVGPTVPLSVKINARRTSSRPFDDGEPLEDIQALDRAPIDLLEISGGDFLSAAMFGVGANLRFGRNGLTPQTEAYFLDFARAVRQHVRKPLMLTGGLRSARQMNAALASGTVDALGLARPLIIEPGLARRLLGEPGDALVTSSIGASPKSGRTKGPWPGLMEVSWYTTQLWRLARGLPPAPEMSSVMALCFYLGRQAAQQLRRVSASGRSL